MINRDSQLIKVQKIKDSRKFVPKWDVYIMTTPSKTHYRRGGRKIIGADDNQGKNIIWARKNSCTYVLTEIVTMCSRPAQAQIRQPQYAEGRSVKIPTLLRS